MIPYQAPNVTAPQNDVNFFTSDVLPFGTYTLTINVTTASPSAPFYLDYVAVEVPGPAPSAALLSASTQSTACSILTHLPVTAFVPPSHRPFGATVCGAFAGLLGIVGALLMCHFYYFKQKRRIMLPEHNGKYDTAEKGMSSPCSE